ncbi:hypothetical protein BC831DRAFT_510251 [Entophlyctis helioformis]|nr:hypothetical protein BC831DRAFT_510251 [Entophlyctis helioformis]
MAVLVRQRDEQMLRSRHLQLLLRESQETVDRQAKEIGVLRRAVVDAGGSGGSPRSATAETVPDEILELEMPSRVMHKLVHTRSSRSVSASTNLVSVVDLLAAGPSVAAWSPGTRTVPTTSTSPMEMDRPLRIYRSPANDVLVTSQTARSVHTSRSSSLKLGMPLPDPLSVVPDSSRVSPQPPSPVRASSPSRSLGTLTSPFHSFSAPLHASRASHHRLYQSAASIPRSAMPLPLSLPVQTRDTSRDARSPDRSQLVRERDALEEELLMRYTQLRGLEANFTAELEKPWLP